MPTAKGPADPSRGALRSVRPGATTHSAATGHRSPATGYRVPAIGYRVPAAGYRPPLPPATASRAS
ncbi:hypothetical protein DCW30_29185 [Streptomyces alfalfae]|nr:hypothetical protein DCW30_29185 [Streptomyces alfalfae]